MKSLFQKLFLPLYCLLFLLACSLSEQKNEVLLFDFEKESELNGIEFKCKTRFKLSDSYKKRGKSSLELQFYPTNLVGFILNDINYNIHSDYVLKFWVFNPSHEEFDLFIKDNILKLEKKYLIKHGENEVVISWSNNIKSRTKRKLSIYLKNINKTTILYFDDIKLNNFIVQKKI